LPYFLLLLSGCAFKNSHVAELARSRLIGLSEVELESCIGAPDQHASFGGTDVLTYYASSTSTSTGPFQSSVVSEATTADIAL
jgi:hypothetical protein